MAEIRINIRADDKASAKFSAMQKAGTSAFNKLKTAASSTITSMKKNWMAFAAAATGAFLAVKKVINIYASYEQRMAEVSTLVNTAEVDMQRLSDAVLSLSLRMPQSAEALAGALYQIISAGVDAANAMYVLEQSARAGVAGLTDVKVAADVGTTILNAYGMSVRKLSQVFDILFMGVKLGKTTFAELGSTLGRVVTMAAVSKISFETVIAAITQMTKVGINTQEAVVSLRQAIISLVSPTDQAREAMGKLGIKYTDFMGTIKQLKEANLTPEEWKLIVPEVRALIGLQALVANYEGLVGVLEQVENAAGAMDEAFKKMEGTVSNRMKIMANQMKFFVVKGIVALYGAFQWLAAGVLNLTGVVFKLAQGLAWLAGKLGITKNAAKNLGDAANAAFLAAEESAMKAADAFGTLSTSAEDAAKESSKVALEQQAAAIQFKDTAKAVEELSNTYRKYYKDLQTFHTTAMDNMKAKSRELLQIEQQLRKTRMTTEDLVLSIQQKSMGAYEKYYSVVEDLENKYAMAMKLSGKEKISLLKSIQGAWAGISDEVREGGEEVISASSAEWTALDKIKGIGEEIADEQSKKIPALQKEIEAWGKVKAEAESALTAIKEQITALPLDQTLKLDAKQAMEGIRKVKSALDLLKDKTITVTVNHLGKGSSVKPLTEKLKEISDMYESSIPTGADFTADLSQITGLLSLYTSMISQMPAFTTSPSHPGFQAQWQATYSVRELYERPMKLIESILEQFLSNIGGSFQSGTSYVPKTGIYQLHQGETVLPAHEVNNYRSDSRVTYAPVFYIDGSKSPKETAMEIDKILARQAKYDRSEFARALN